MTSVKKLFCCMLAALLFACISMFPVSAIGTYGEKRFETTPLRGTQIGDVDQNGEIEASDALIILRFTMGLIELSPGVQSLCDADGNGEIEASDALLVLRMALGLAEAPTPEPTQRPEITEMPEPVSVDDMEAVISIPLVYDTDYDPETDYACIMKMNFYGDDDTPIVSGPASYAVADGRLMVLDAFAELIRVYDLDSGEWVKNIDASAARFTPLNSEGSMTYWNGYYWIYSIHNGFVVAIDEDGNEIMNVPAPDIGSMEDYDDPNEYIEAWTAVFGAVLLVIDGELYLKTHGYVTYNMPDYKLEGDAFVPCEPKIRYTLTDYPDWAYVITNGEYTWFVPTDEELDFGVNALETDEYGNLYASCSLLTVDSNGHLHSDQDLRIYDKDSRLVGIFRYTMTEPIDYGTHIVRKDTTGVWMMHCTENEVRIVELPFETVG